MTRARATLGDVAVTLQIVGAALVSWIVPERFWLPLTRAVGRAATWWRLPQDGPAASPFDDILSALAGCSVRDLVTERIATGYQSRLYGLREYRPWRLDIAITLVGARHLEHALAGGGGAILWIAGSTSASLVTKVGLHRAGFRVSHLSRPTHGWGSSAFAVRWLNPIWTRVEERHLRDRVVLQPGAEAAGLRTLRRCLAGNGIVSIAVGREGLRTVEVGLSGRPWRLATGPVTLATRSGAPLLPVFAFQVAGARFQLVLDPPLDTGGAELTREERERRVAQEYACRLGPWIRRYPGQWLP